MRSSMLFAAIVAQSSLVISAPSATTEPCAQVSAALARNDIVDPVSHYTVVDADTAYACLNSVPLDHDGGVAQLTGLKTLLRFQSDLSYLDNPPAGWLYPGVDVLGSLDGMLKKLQSGGYENEYTFQLEIYNLVKSIHDFHAVYVPDIIKSMFWNRATQLVSISVDGVSLPNVYDVLDSPALEGLNGTSYKPSPVVKINDTDVETWLNDYANKEPWDHDPDANYNKAFVNIPAELYAQVNSQLSSASSFSQSFYHFPGSQTILTFSNGSSKAVRSHAAVPVDFTGVTDGKTFFKKICSGPQASSSASASSLPSSTNFASYSFAGPSASGSATISGSATASVSGVASSSVTTNNLYTPLASATPLPNWPSYPAPFVLSPDGSLGGYLPEGQNDLAVAAIPTFGPSSDFVFQNNFRTFLATAKSMGKKRLVLDLRANGGGNVVDGFSLFKELFPSKTAFGASNLAAWPLLDAIGLVASGVPNNDTLRGFSFVENLDLHNQQYDSWSDFFGPVARHGGEYTSITRYNFSSPYNGLGNAVYGYQNDTKPQPQTFEPENIVVLTDGFCGSTCAIFAELLKTQAGVQFIAVGGRKQSGPMQAIGGSKGSNDQEMKNLATNLQDAYQEGDKSQRAIFEPYLNAGLQTTSQQALNRATAFNVNFQNNLRNGDDTYTPLMFVYEAADCRFFYTPAMLTSQEAVWQHTYNLRWGNATCVPGSTGQPSSQPAFGNGTTDINAAPPKSATNFFGADLTWSYPGALKLGEKGASPSQSASVSSSAPTSTGTSASAPEQTGGAASSAGASAVVVLVSMAAGFLLV